MASKKSKLKVISLGGLQEIGKNMTVLEFNQDIIIIDAGLGFPEDEMLGVDLVIPDISYLVKNADKVRGIVLTHGHEDHIGGLPYVLKDLNVPVFGTLLTLGLLENKLKEHGMMENTTRHVVVPGVTLEDKYLSELGVFFKGFDNIEKVEVLPYHSLARHKYEAMGLEYPLGDTPDGTKEQAEYAKKIIMENMK